MEMLFDSEKYLHSTSSSSFEDLYSYINAIPALFWSIDVVKNKIEYINKYALPGLGDSSHFIIQNPDFADQMIIDEDKYIFESFMKGIKSRKQGLAVFRIKLYDGTIRWLKIAGNRDIYKSNHYIGYIMDITETARFIRSIDHSNDSIIKKINIFNNPVLLIEFDNKKVFAYNNKTLDSFGVTHEKIMSMRFEDLFKDDIQVYLNAIYEEIIFAGQWKGELVYKSASGKEFISNTSIRPIHVEERNLLWVSIYNIPDLVKNDPDKISPDISVEIDFKSMNREALSAAKKGNITRLLEIMLENQPLHGLADAVLYSDIHVEEGRVVVWGAGDAFHSLTPAYTYPYEGTIAENILNYNLDHIIVENTFESIKPVDWAIFIPNGIKSYFAKPFYNNGKLVTVLIFCSTGLSVFNEDNIKSYDAVYSVFVTNLEIIKKKKLI
jgi:hypothetical protein